MLMDQTEIDVMVDDFWRHMLQATANGNGDGAKAIVSEFEKMAEGMAGIMPPEDAGTFKAMVEVGREKIFREYNANPTALKRRLGIKEPIQAAPSRHGGRMGLGELGVRTAVRATVWQSIASLFRAFR